MTATTDKKTTGEGVQYGPFRAPRNLWQGAPDSIHNDETARALGFAGGTIPASVHIEQFVPFLKAALGIDWLRRGNLSLYFLAATTDNERVRCAAEVAAKNKGRARVFMEREDGLKVCEGTTSAYPDDPSSELLGRLKALRPARDLRMLKSVQVGLECAEIPCSMPRAKVEERLTVITEPVSAYRDGAEYGGIVLPPDVLINAFRKVEGALIRVEGPFVGLFGAFEIRMIAGPIFADKDYLVRGRVLGLGDSPKTELLWYEATLRDAASGRDVASTLHMTRLMKASSPLYSGDVAIN